MIGYCVLSLWNCKMPAVVHRETTFTVGELNCVKVEQKQDSLRAGRVDRGHAADWGSDLTAAHIPRMLHLTSGTKITVHERRTCSLLCNWKSDLQMHCKPAHFQNGDRFIIHDFNPEQFLLNSLMTFLFFCEEVSFLPLSCSTEHVTLFWLAAVGLVGGVVLSVNSVQFFLYIVSKVASRCFIIMR